MDRLDWIVDWIGLDWQPCFVLPGKFVIIDKLIKNRLARMLSNKTYEIT